MTGDASRRVAILGSTGSIGRQALEVAAAFRGQVKVVGLAAGGTREDVFLEQLARWRPGVAALDGPEAARRVAARSGREVLGGPEGLAAVAAWPEADLVLNAMVGFAGTRPTLAAIAAGKDVALANKEPLVAAGRLITAAARARGVTLLPVDSEPSAIYQLLAGRPGSEVERIVLTASGGPFYGAGKDRLARVTAGEALRHPTWKMGPKITVDSATLMNKGFEVIEASWLFGLPVDRIAVVVHRQSVVHSLVELSDGVVLAHLGPPDMRYPIQFALTYPERLRGPWPRLDLTQGPPLAFEQVDSRTFPGLRLAYEVGRIGQSLPAVLSAADEVLVAAFLAGRIGFLDIPRRLAGVVAGHEPFAIETLEDAERADGAGRRAARETLDG